MKNMIQDVQVWNTSLSTTNNQVAANTSWLGKTLTATLLLLTLGIGQMWGLDLYLDISAQSGWTNDGATLKLYPGTGSDVTGTYVATNLYKFTVTSATGTMYFKRMSGASIWNQFSVTYNASYNLYRLTGWDSGVCANENIKNVTKTNYIYFDNSTTNWSNANRYFVIGHDKPSAYSKVYSMTAIAHTKLWYVAQSSDTWSDATYYGFCNPTSSWSVGSWGSSNLSNGSKYTAAYKNKYDLGSGSSYLFTPANASNGTSFSIDYKNNYSALNNSQTVKKYTSTNNGSSYSEASINSGTITISAYKMTGNGTASNSSNSATLDAAAETSASRDAAYTGEVTLTASANTGYTFIGWFRNASGGTALSTNTTYSYNAPNSTQTTYARFSLNHYTVSYGVNSSTRWGSIKLNTNSAVTTTSTSSLAHGTSISFTATPNSGYQVEGWYSDAACTAGNKLQTGGNSYNAGTLTANVTVYVKFAVRTGGTVTLTAGTGGQVSKTSGSGWAASVSITNITSTTAINIYAKANTGYSFSTWTKTEGSGTVSTNAANGQFTPVAFEDATVQASFTETMRTITISGGTESSTTAGVATQGTATAADPAAGKKFTGWTLGSGVTLAAGSALTNKTINFTATANSTVTANYADRAKVKLYFAKPTTLSWTNVYAYAWKSSDASVKNATYPGVKLTATEVINCVTYYVYEYYTEADGVGGAADGNSAWNTIIFGDNNDARKTANLTISNGHFYYKNSTGTGETAAITSAWFIKGEFNSWGDTAPITHNCATNSGDAIISITAGSTYGWKVYNRVNDQWWSNSTALGSGSGVTATMASAQTLYNNDDNNMKITPSVTSNYTFTVSSTNTSTPKVTVTFPTTYILTYSIGSVKGNNGSITTSPSTASGSKVLSGNTVTLTAPAAKTGYTWKGWYTNAAGTTGKINDTNRAITVTMNANKTLYACYTENSYTVTVSAGVGGMVSPTSVTAGPVTTSASITASPAVGYAFLNWTIPTGVTLASGTTSTPTITINATAGSKTITANFISTNNRIVIRAQIGESFFTDNMSNDGTNNKWKEVNLHYWNTNNSKNLTIYSGCAAANGTWVNEGNRWYEFILPAGITKADIQFYSNALDHSYNSLKSVTITDVQESGCYLILPDQDGELKRKVKVTEDCALYYRVKTKYNETINFYSNRVYKSNQDMSFFISHTAKQLKLQHHNGVEWIDIKDITSYAPTPASNATHIYTAQFKGATATKPVDDYSAYTGDYFIRSDIAPGGWSEYTNAGNKMTYFNDASSTYNHYWVAYTGDGVNKNIDAEVGNAINPSLSRTLQDRGVLADGYGYVSEKNVRYSYDNRVGYLDYAVISGSTSANFLTTYGADATPSTKVFKLTNTGTKGTATSESNAANQVTFEDLSDWRYQADVWTDATNGSNVTIGVIARLADKSPQDLVPKERPLVALGTTTTTGSYIIRIIYDFKQNTIVTGWLPKANETIGSNTTIQGNMILNRVEGGSVPQITITNDAHKLTGLQKLYMALEIQRDNASGEYQKVRKAGSNTTITSNATETDKNTNLYYWISLPYACRVSDIFGLQGTYGYKWGLFRYRGDRRAQNGLFIDSGTYWEFVGENDILQPYEGYALAIDLHWSDFNQITINDVTRSSKYIYFPTMQDGYTLENKTTTTNLEDYTCTIKGREEYDTGWHIIGVPGYHDINITSTTGPTFAIADKIPAFYYEYVYNNHGDTGSSDNNAYTYHTTTSLAGGGYKAFHGYFVQYNGTINWQKAADNTKTPIRRRANSNKTNYFESATLELLLSTDDIEQDNTFVQLQDEATEDFDYNLDLAKMKTSKVPNLYTLGSKGEELAANCLPIDTRVIDLGLMLPVTADYTFSLRNTELPTGLQAILYDTETRQEIDLSQDDYTVTLAKGTHNGRLQLRLSVSTVDIGTDIRNNAGTGNLTATVVDGKLLLSGLGDEGADLRIYDPAGRLVYEGHAARGYSIPLPAVAGVYLVNAGNQVIKVVK